MSAVIVGGLVFLACWFVMFMVGLLVDEDANHWDWARDDGPGPVVTTKIALGSACMAAVLGVLAWLLVLLLF